MSRRPSLPPLPDLSHLSEDERKIIESVLQRQREEEEKEQDLLKTLQDDLKKIEDNAKKNETIPTDTGAVCQICNKTKFADGVGHACHYCKLRSCARCGGKLGLKNNKPVISATAGSKTVWACNICRKKQQIAAKTGQWYHGGQARPVGLDVDTMSGSETGSNKTDTSPLSESKMPADQNVRRGPDGRPLFQRTGSRELRRQFSTTGPGDKMPDDQIDRRNLNGGSPSDRARSVERGPSSYDPAMRGRDRSMPPGGFRDERENGMRVRDRSLPPGGYRDDRDSGYRGHRPTEGRGRPDPRDMKGPPDRRGPPDFRDPNMAPEARERHLEGMNMPAEMRGSRGRLGSDRSERGGMLPESRNLTNDPRDGVRGHDSRRDGLGPPGSEQRTESTPMADSRGVRDGYSVNDGRRDGMMDGRAPPSGSPSGVSPEFRDRSMPVDRRGGPRSRSPSSLLGSRSDLRQQMESKEEVMEGRTRHSPGVPENMASDGRGLDVRAPEAGSPDTRQSIDNRGRTVGRPMGRDRLIDRSNDHHQDETSRSMRDLSTDRLGENEKSKLEDLRREDLRSQERDQSRERSRDRRLDSLPVQPSNNMKDKLASHISPGVSPTNHVERSFPGEGKYMEPNESHRMDDLDNIDRHLSSKPPPVPRTELTTNERINEHTKSQKTENTTSSSNMQHLDPSSAATRPSRSSRRSKMEAMLRNDSLSSDPSDCVRPPPPRPHKHKSRNKKLRQDSFSSSEDEIRSTPECTSCDDQESETVSEKGLAQTYQKLGVPVTGVDAYDGNLRKDELIAAKIKQFLAHPVTWQQSEDGSKTIGHMILKKGAQDGSGKDSGAILGLKVIGGKMTEYGRLGAFITKVKRGSIADTVGHLKAGDEVLEWNGRSLKGATFEEVYDIILESKQEPQVELIVQRDNTGNDIDGKYPHEASNSRGVKFVSPG